MRKKVGMLLSGLLSLALLAAPVNTIHAETYGHSDAVVGVKKKKADKSKTQSWEDD